jgi:3-oxoacyl-[acyl-carrier-protein] synthase II
MDDPRRVVITGYGLVSALGDFGETWEGLLARRAPVSRRSCSRYPRFPFARAYSLAQPAPAEKFASRSDLRAMGPCMRQAVLAAGMAIEHAGLRECAEILGHAGLFLGARHDARDWEVDAAIAQEIAGLDAYEPRLNELLSRRLRPGLFLAQLPNLFAGNLCIVFQILGTSMTFLGEQGAGASALEQAVETIRAGDLEVALAGASFDGDEYQVRFALGGSGCLSPDRDGADLRPVEPWNAGADGSVAGSAAAFVVLESLEHARGRAAVVRAELASVSSATGPRRAGSIAASLTRQYEAALARTAPVSALIGNGAGIRELDGEELAFLQRAAAGQTRTYLTTPSASLGEVFHASLPCRVALATAALERQQLFGIPVLDGIQPLAPELRIVNEPIRAPLCSIAAVSVGTFESEAMAVVRRCSPAEDG